MKQHSTKVVPAHSKVAAWNKDKDIYIWLLFTHLESAACGCNNYIYAEDFC